MGKLIRLELCNFKSYKGHHTLLFGDSYFTSIIGPNGSGKSNSMDAISFVLGIKSSHLRSAHLKDLVYRGRVLKTSKINDDGSATTEETHDAEDAESPDKSSRNDPRTAWVMAVYEDDAGEEVRWKRSITTQGSSEYRINERVVTAQQYNAALEAENILIKARNFLVFQGDVEAIAAQSPQDLTRLIEQISGSLDYKAEYERLEAEADVAAENANHQLQRRRGINSEIKQYQEQKKEAENFQRKTDERDDAIVTRTLWKLHHIQTTMDESTTKIRNHQEDLKEHRRNVDSFERKLEEARKDQSSTSREIGKIERAIRLKERDMESSQTGLIPIEEKIQTINQEYANLTDRLETTRKDVKQYQDVVNRTKSDLATVEKAEQLYEKEYSERMKKLGKEVTDGDRKEYQALRHQVNTKTSSIQSNFSNFVRQQKTDESTVSTFKGKIDLAKTALEKHKTELDSLNQRKSATDSVVKQLAKEIDGKKKQFNHMQSERVRTNQKRTELEEKIESLSAKFREADDGRRQNDREARMKEMVVSLKRIYPGVKGRIGSLCKPKQKKFDEAVIVALGRDFDSVVVDTEKTGISCVQYLKEHRFPPITFIPLDNIKVNAVNTAIKGINGARLTIDTIDFDSVYERAMAYACGNSVVCDSLEIARRVTLKTPVKAVTLEGYVIHKAGLMTGGRGPEKGKRRFEEHDVQNLERAILAAKEELDKLPRRERNAEEALQHELSSLQQRHALAKNELDALERNIANVTKLADNEQRKLVDLEPEFADKSTALARIRGKVAELQKEISVVEDSTFAKFCKRLGYSDIRDYDAQQGSMEQEIAEERSKFSAQKQRLNGNLDWENSRCDATKARVSNLEAQLQKRKKDLKGYNSEKTKIQKSLAVAEEELDALKETLEEYRSELDEKAEKVAEARQELQKRSREIDALQKEISALESVVQTQGNAKFNLLRRCKMEQINVPLASGSLDDLPNQDNILLVPDPDAMELDEEDEDEQMMDAAMQDHGIEIDFDNLDDDLKDSDDPSVEEGLEEKVAALTAELEKLNPNMRAIERLESVEGRLKSTERDFEDARNEHKQARDAFNEIKALRFELFSKAFTHIQEQISNVYRDLTRSEAYPLGGQAYLDIEEDTDTPYLSGIKYHAMPPLKRFRDMEHLSGGEKTMAALALLFAIHSYQPSPFFVLDEVDAALDNANVGKIKKYILEHAGPGMQFIVISLKAGLFQDSESLVGVYRDQDVNSSKTMTLDLRKYT
ncbi:Structural maintenance of chromosomes protein 1 [Ceratocystis platani]|uniref:Structural maintenance of chromosomes protein n=1 Tax=Ceratocystis fimbriata f. sp. platani TaxID=88771 RepID=A0A0F8DJR7_CERFI|nr:Structural maintenance of chromosomes protein 1 [Ceratocystis platani]